MRLAIMQPYFFPYIGYFQLINAVDIFVFYDDVNYIKGGWINRNKILINNQGAFFTLTLKDASPNKLINEIEIIDNREKIGKTIQMAYRKAPNFENVWTLIQKCLEFDSKRLSDIAIYSVTLVAEYLGLQKSFEISGERYPDTKGKERAERLIEICNRNNAEHYINPIGGKELYSNDKFALNDIQLSFIKSKDIHYPQFGKNFIPWLSIIDVLMFNPKEKVLEMLNAYELE